jgi:hypothetical protein
MLKLLNRNGMTTLKNKSKDKPTDAVDILIYEKGLRIKTILPIKDLDLMIIVLNNGRIIKSKISCFKILKNATQEQLNKWELRLAGVALRWEELDEDLSLRGFITNNVMNDVLHRLETSDLELAEVI